MKRKKKEIEVQGTKFVVEEMRVKDMVEIMPRFSKDDEATQATVDMMKKCVYLNGQLLGDAIDELGISTFMMLSETVTEVNGLSGKD